MMSEWSKLTANLREVCGLPMLMVVVYVSSPLVLLFILAETDCVCDVWINKHKNKNRNE